MVWHLEGLGVLLRALLELPKPDNLVVSLLLPLLIAHNDVVIAWQLPLVDLRLERALIHLRLVLLQDLSRSLFLTLLPLHCLAPV